MARNEARTKREIFDLSDLPRYPGDLTRYWHPIARSEEVTEEPRRFMLLEEPVVAFRDGEGVVAFKDLCIHRGTALSLGERTAHGTIMCAYHGWEYDRTGKCVRIPSRPEGSTIPSSARAIAYAAAEAYDVVWVAMNEPVAPIPPFPNNEYDDPNWRGYLAFVQTWRSSAGRMIENFCDWSHLPWVHPNLLGSRDKAVVEPYDVWEREDAIGFTYEQNEPNELYGGELQDRWIRYEFIVYLPFTVHLYKHEPEERTTMISMSVAPIEPKLSTLYLWQVRNHTLEPEVDEAYVDFSRQVFAQDKRVVESQRPEEIPLDLKEELHIRVPDAFSVQYRRVLQKISEVTPYLPY